MAKEGWISKFLLKNGLSQEELDALSSAQKEEIYSQGIRRYIEGFTQPRKKVEEKISNPFLALKHPQEVYDLSGDFFKTLSIDDAVLMFHRRFRSLSIDKAQKMMLLLFALFQENLLAEIEQKIITLPQEERRSIMEIYERQKEDIPHLLQINKKLSKEDFLQKFQEVLEIKMLVQRHQESLKNEEENDE